MRLLWWFAMTAMASGLPSVDTIRMRLLDEALKQGNRVTDEWDPAQRDCAGFVRHLYRKSLGQSVWVDGRGKQALYLGAAELLAFNFVRVSHSINDHKIHTGDVLAFFDPQKPPLDRWHLMVMLKSPGKNEVIAIYHTGLQGLLGEVRKVWLKDLVAAGPAAWRPLPSNHRFLGHYRWKGWQTLGETE